MNSSAVANSRTTQPNLNRDAERRHWGSVDIRPLESSRGVPENVEWSALRLTTGVKLSGIERSG